MTCDHKRIEQKWQDHWKKSEAFKAKIDKTKPKYYALEMFPYPSGKLHMGHVRNYTLGDAAARFRRAQGYNVLHPFGWDSFGLPAENAAMRHNLHPETWTEENIAIGKKQAKALGLGCDWGRELSTCQSRYYRHEQEMFLSFLENDLAYQKESLVNWDPVDNTVLANEQVVDGLGWRSGARIERRKLKQWFFRTTAFQEDLIEDLKHLSKWPEKVRIMQENWIGYSKGAVIDFRVKDESNKIAVYSTRPDTLFGAAFVAISYDHPVLQNRDLSDEAKAFIKECQNTSLAAEENIEKKGCDTEILVVHPFDEKITIPVYIANFVLSDYGTGAVFACPAHDQRDYEFARKYGIDMIQVVDGAGADISKSAYTDAGTMINSGFLNGLHSSEAKEKSIEKLIELGAGRGEITYRLRDWGVSRQRYWGCPIPVIHCDDCGVVPVPRSELPVKLPKDVDFSVTGNPLDHHPSWKKVSCPKCSKPAVRETDTFDTFIESSWYFLQFCASDVSKRFTQADLDYWMPVDQYIGGVEHAVQHLLYARFFVKALKKCGYIDSASYNDEPFDQLMTQGMVCNTAYKREDGVFVPVAELVMKDGRHFHEKTGKYAEPVGVEKMSKSKYNGVDPDDILQKYGADTARLFILSDTPPARDFDWSDSGVAAANKYIKRLFASVEALISAERQHNITQRNDDAVSDRALKEIHTAIHEVTRYYDNFEYNKVIARSRELGNYSAKNTHESRMILEYVIRLLNPIIPHVSEEMWEMLRRSDAGRPDYKNDMPSGNELYDSHGYKEILHMSWPKPDMAIVQSSNVNLPVQINGKVRAVIVLEKGVSEEHALQSALPMVEKYVKGEIKKVIYVQDRVLNIII